MRDTYEAETAWAPRFVGPELRAVRVGAQQSELGRARAAAEARAAQARGDHDQAERQRGLAASAETLRTWYEARTGELEQADQDYRDWEHATEGARRLAAAADAELRRRDPGLALPSLRTAEPTPVTDTERAELGKVPERGREHETPGWVRQLAQARPAFREQLRDRHSVRIPDPDPEYGDHGPAWPAPAPRQRDAILQPAAPEMPPVPGLGAGYGRDAEPEARQ